MLTTVTGQRHWEALLLGTDWVWNDEAGEVAGVVSIKYVGSLSGDDLDGATIALARQVVRQLRAELPAATFEASWADEASYALSAPLAKRQRDDGRSIVSLPSATENPLARPCEKCHQSAASGANSEGNHCCADCHLRYEAAGNSYRAPGALQPIIDELIGSGDNDATDSLPKDMEELAKTGRATLRNAATRVAVVYADGNNLGITLKHFANTAGLASIARDVDEATKSAFVAAGRRCLPEANAGGHQRIGVIPHIVGGDDVVASVAAPFAWDFVVTLAGEFVDRLGGQAWLEGGKVPDLSVGIVFQHESEPLTHTFERAASRLGEAKKMRVAALNWVDLQIDAPDVVHPSRSVEWVATRLDDARELAAKPAHLRQTLRSALAGGDVSWWVVQETVRKQGVSSLKELVGADYTTERASDLLWLLQIARDIPPVNVEVRVTEEATR